MSTPQFGSPEWLHQFEQTMAEAGRKLSESLARAGHILAAQGAMGWMYRGNVDQARAALKGMSPEQLHELSAAAAALASLADEELSGR